MFGPFGAVVEIAMLTHTHTEPCHGFIAKAGDFFATSAQPSGKEMGM